MSINNGLITQSHSTGTVGGSGVGGLVYANNSNGVINESFAAGLASTGGLADPQ
ncbi:hypothetical protein [Caballeronia arvi]|uniref:hypothetical protein n=1 Tax=Caballeronia arvi TaxID=1777135 RepID=UPI000A507C6F|nr:hypothetical protein [Caballeronia arvi]